MPLIINRVSRTMERKILSWQGGADMPVLLDLFLTFARVGMFTFGGGYAMIAVFEDICVRKKQWITHEDMMNITVIAETTPGPVAINCATFVGYHQKGLAGACAATVGIVLPSFFVIYLISGFLDHFLEIAWIANAFRGIKIAVGILILDAAIGMIRKMPKKKLSLAIMISAFAAAFCINIFPLGISSIVILLAGGVLNLGVFLLDKPYFTGKRG